jgi:hypothetical protein
MTEPSKKYKKSSYAYNVGFTCKDVWRGPGASQVRDKRLCQVEAPVRVCPPNSKLGPFRTYIQNWRTLSHGPEATTAVDHA